jgi:aromatic-L-amino-acid decarboxylase
MFAWMAAHRNPEQGPIRSIVRTMAPGHDRNRPDHRPPAPPPTGSDEGDRPVDPLGMDPEEMRRLGHWVVDQVVDHFQHRADGPAISVGDADELRSALGGPLPRLPGDPMEAMRMLTEVALANMQHGGHPRYFARVPGPSSSAGVLGEWLGTGFNAIASSWGGGSGPATVELVALDWLREALGLAEGTEGVLVSGGSMANMTAIVAARAQRGQGVAYMSDQTHSSIGRGLVALGFATGDINVLESDGDLRLPVADLERAIAEDRRAGRQPRFVIATAGTTNTGAVDPLPELADLCERERLWFHVDGAYGAPAALCARGRDVLTGLERVDSLVLDPHKWLFQPYDIGCLFMRPGTLSGAFRMDPEYLVDVMAGRGEVDLRNRSLELTRRSRAMKLWLSFKTYGMDAIGAAVERGIELAELAEAMIREDDRFTVVTPAQLGIVTFALAGAGEAEHRASAGRLAEDGYAAVTATALKDRPVLRLCTINPQTTETDLRGTLERLADADPRRPTRA